MFLVTSFAISGCEEKKAEASFSSTIIDFGTKLHSDTIVGQISLTNTGEKDLIIEDVKAGCGCTVPKYATEPIKKNEVRKISFTYVPNSGETGTLHKEIVVHTNSTKKLQVISINGKII